MSWTRSPPPTCRHAWPGAPTTSDRSLRTELAEAARRLDAAGVASPRTDAHLLAAYVLGVPRGQLPLVREAPAEALERFWDLVGRRADRAPLQHLTGEAYFRHLTLAVGPGVFVPRPETETVVGWVIEALIGARSAREADPGPADGPVCVDLCAGSGAIALALADEVPGAEVHAVEADPAALDYLRRNVAATGLPVRVHTADVLGVPPTGTEPDVGEPGTTEPTRPEPTRPEPTPRDWARVPVLDALAGLVGRVDAVVSNPPYLPDADRAVVEPEVGRYDPPWALWGGGDDGLTGPRAVALTGAALLRPGGLFAMEHADGQGDATRALLAEAGGWSEITTRRDLAGRDRFITARRQGPAVRADLGANARP